MNQVERACRWWKRLSLGALAALILVLLGAAGTLVSQQQQIQAERQRTEQALSEAEAQRNQAQRVLYFNEMALAEREWAARPDAVSGSKTRPTGRPSGNNR